jgi:Protein of unknown function (DUF4012)
VKKASKVLQVKIRDVEQEQISTTPNHRRKRVTIKALLLLCLISSSLLGIGYKIGATSYQSDFSLATEGAHHLLQAEHFLIALSHNPLDIQMVVEAKGEFVAAASSFVRINNDLRFVPAPTTSLPVYGSRIYVALHMAPLALALAQMGETGCDILYLLAVRLQNPLHAQAVGITTADFLFLTQQFRDIRASFTAASNELKQLQSVDMGLDAHTHTLLETLRKDMPVLRAWLENIWLLLPAIPAILGIASPANYLIEVLDSTELRPGGGFIGNYGLMTLAEGRLSNAYITDTDLLDQPFIRSGNGIPFPLAYRWFDIAHGNWGLRDSNLDADFPTAARSAELLYKREGGDTPLQGVIAITPAFIQQALTITGPIVIPEYHQQVTPSNLIDLIHFHQLGKGVEGPDNIPSPDGHSSLRKRFIALLAQHFLTRIGHLSSSDYGSFVQLIINSVRTKDMQMYFSDSAAERLLLANQLAATLQTPRGDDLFVVNTNIASNKANSLINSTLTDNVTIDSEGNATHHATLRYAWTRAGQNYGFALYRDYTRIYVPEGSVLQEQGGWQSQGSNSAFGHTVWAGFFTLLSGQIRTIRLTWLVPHVSIHDADGWLYQKTVQRQAGVLWTLHTQVTLPPCATIKTVSAGLQALDKRNAVIDQVLTENKKVAISYTC